MNKVKQLGRDVFYTRKAKRSVELSREIDCD